MNLRFLQTVIAVSTTGSLAGAADMLGLSHSAVSLQIKALEDELQIRILDRSTRPPRLTDDGLSVLEYGEQLLKLAADIRSIGQSDSLVGAVKIGVVPSVLVKLIPPALANLRLAHPKLSIDIATGMSDDLMSDVAKRKLDFALLTQPGMIPDGLTESVICEEPLDVIIAADIPAASTREILMENPFILFNRRTWTGQQIDHYLRSEKLQVKLAMEIDSIEAIEALVAHGLGVSISPRRVGFPESDPRLRRLPIGPPFLLRRLTLVQRDRGPRKRVAKALERELKRIAGQTATTGMEAPDSHG